MYYYSHRSTCKRQTHLLIESIVCIPNASAFLPAGFIERVMMIKSGATAPRSMNDRMMLLLLLLMLFHSLQHVLIRNHYNMKYNHASECERQLLTTRRYGAGRSAFAAMCAALRVEHIAFVRGHPASASECIASLASYATDARISCTPDQSAVPHPEAPIISDNMIMSHINVRVGAQTFCAFGWTNDELVRRVESVSRYFLRYYYIMTE